MEGVRDNREGRPGCSGAITGGTTDPREVRPDSRPAPDPDERPGTGKTGDALMLRWTSGGRIMGPPTRHMIRHVRYEEFVALKS